MVAKENVVIEDFLSDFDLNGLNLIWKIEILDMKWPF